MPAAGRFLNLVQTLPVRTRPDRGPEAGAQCWPRKPEQKKAFICAIIVICPRAYNSLFPPENSLKSQYFSPAGPRGRLAETVAGDPDSAAGGDRKPGGPGSVQRGRGPYPVFQKSTFQKPLSAHSVEFFLSSSNFRIFCVFLEHSTPKKSKSVLGQKPNNYGHLRCIRVHRVHCAHIFLTFILTFFYEIVFIFYTIISYIFL